MSDEEMADFCILVLSEEGNWIAYSDPNEDSIGHECMSEQFDIQSRRN